MCGGSGNSNDNNRVFIEVPLSMIEALYGRDGGADGYSTLTKEGSGTTPVTTAKGMITVKMVWKLSSVIMGPKPQSFCC